MTAVLRAGHAFKFRINSHAEVLRYPHIGAGLFHRVEAACKSRITIAFDSHFRHL
jgi:hypothetical protein